MALNRDQRTSPTGYFFNSPLGAGDIEDVVQFVELRHLDLALRSERIQIETGNSGALFRAGVSLVEELGNVGELDLGDLAGQVAAE